MRSFYSALLFPLPHASAAVKARGYCQIIIITTATAPSLFINCTVRRTGKRRGPTCSSRCNDNRRRSFVFNVTSTRRRSRAGHYEFVRTWFCEKETSTMTTATTTTTTCRVPKRLSSFSAYARSSLKVTRAELFTSVVSS